MSDQPKPSPYKFCDAHMRPSIGPNRCNECFGPVANPVNDEPVQKVNKPTTTLESPTVITTTAPAAEPALTDPVAQKIVEAAHSYARAKEAVKIITEQVSEARELLHGLEKKLKETIAIADAAQNELRDATKTT